MFKRILVSSSLACIIVSLIASACLAYGFEGSDTITGYNGSYSYTQAWADYSAYPNTGYHVTVYVNRSGTHLGYNTTTVLPGNSARCYSKQVAGYGGSAGYYAVPH